jgi:Spy/CpxP family protein refolding chaperone
MKRSLVVLALLVAPLAVPLDAQGPPGGGAPGPAQGQSDPFGKFLFSPELVMQHQGQIQLQDGQRAALQAAIAQAQAKFVDAQWKISAEGEKLARLLQTPTVDEKLVLEQVDRILEIEREIKRAQMGLMVRIKNTLTPPQQAKLRELRGSE